MSEDQFTEYTETSWFGRLGNALKGIVLGLILFVVSFPLLFWNEGRAVKTYKTLVEGGKVAVTVTADRVDAANDGKLVHLTGKAVSDATLADSLFAVSAKALKLQRGVEMYQWQETKKSETRKKFGGGSETVTTYDYDRAWSGRLIDSSSFKMRDAHQNPGSMPYETRTWVAQPITVGAFELSRPLVDRISNATPLEIPGSTALPAELAGKAKMTGGGFYIGADPAAPKIGDVRVKFTVDNSAEVSVIARQSKNTFEPYMAKAGGKIEMLQMGTLSIESMIQTAQNENTVITWILRGVGFLLMVIGLNLVMSPLSVLADVIPFIGNVVGAITGGVAFLVAFMLSTLTVAIAWIAYRPLLGIGLIIVALAVTPLIRKKIQAKRQAKAAAKAEVPQPVG